MVCVSCGVRHTFEWRPPIRGEDVGASFHYENECDCWDKQAVLVATMPRVGISDDVPSYYRQHEQEGEAA